MATQITEPELINGRPYLNVTNEPSPILKLLGDLLKDDSSLKKSVDNNPLTIITATNSILGAMTTDGSEELMVRIYKTIEDVLLNQIQQVAIKHKWPVTIQQDLNAICEEIRSLHPFAHRTTVQDMLNGHTKESSDQWLGESFRLSMNELESVGYKPPAVIVNQDPHFADFKPAFKNGEIRQILIGGRTTLKTGYQLNLANISPIGLYNAISLTPKRQENGKDLGELQYAVVYGKAIERVQEVGLSLKQMQGDRGLSALGVFLISQQHAWPTNSGEIGILKEFTKDAFLVTPWSSTRMSKAELMIGKDFAEVFVKSSEILSSQYAGEQLLVQRILGETPGCKVTIETAILVLRKQDNKFCEFNHCDVQSQLTTLTSEVIKQEKRVETFKEEYFQMLWKLNPDYTERGLGMKLNSKSNNRIAKESSDAWAIRKQFCAAQGKIQIAKQKRDIFLREFQIFEIGVDKAALNLLKGLPCNARAELIESLKSCGKDYCSRWCIESGFQIMEYQFPLHYHGYSSNTHVRCFVVQAMMFNSYRVAQINHIGTTKPHNWRPWDPKNKICCRQFRAIDRRSFSTKGYILGLLHESLSYYFCRTLN